MKVYEFTLCTPLYVVGISDSDAKVSFLDAVDNTLNSSCPLVDMRVITSVDEIHDPWEPTSIPYGQNGSKYTLEELFTELEPEVITIQALKMNKTQRRKLLKELTKSIG